ncbi:terminase family protein [Paenibacillus sp. CMAA1739]|uniref:terminase large subunit domain-containing protein n=1 Tax=Paenibacillus ottowii TaxID=2315729 RepID=UPI002DBF8FC8|nr:terminase family protein [Paenibacillus sp. CMAA1739]MEC4565350.1 terminase family protein [Paenibacillus sp. CMAA1739]
MSGYENYQVSRNKAHRGINLFNKSRNFNKSSNKTDKLMHGIGIWASYYRSNPHRFAKEYLGITLKLFQVILIFMMNYSNYFMYLASRGQGKTFLTSIYCVIRCILWPETKIVVASGNMKQAREVIEKISDLRINSPNLAREISDLSTSANDPKVEFHNGSWIKVVASNEGARSKRANCIIVDEFRMVDLNIINKVLRKFLTAPRQPKYLNKPEYSHLQERNKEIYLSSAWYQFHWSWIKLKAYVKSMTLGKNYFICGLPYQLAIKESLLMKEQVLDEMSEDDFDPTAFSMEMGCLFFGESEKAFFKLDDIQKCRTVVKPFYPLTPIEFSKVKDKRKKSTKQDGEIRIIGVDVAMMGGEENDNTIFTCMRLLPNGENYSKQVPYLESMLGAHSEKQAVRLKQIFYDFEADYVAMDTSGNGISLYDDCSRILYDEERDVEYPAWTAMNNDEMKNRALDKNALPIIFSIKVTKAELNHEIAMNLKTSFEKRSLKLLVGDSIGREHLVEKLSYNSKSVEDQVNLMKPYIQTTILVNEMVNLEYEIRSGYVKLMEVGRSRKDRYSSLAYCNYFAKYLETKLKKNDDYDFQFFYN